MRWFICPLREKVGRLHNDYQMRYYLHFSNRIFKLQVLLFKWGGVTFWSSNTPLCDLEPDWHILQGSQQGKSHPVFGLIALLNKSEISSSNYLLTFQCWQMLMRRNVQFWTWMISENNKCQQKLVTMVYRLQGLLQIPPANPISFQEF